MLGMGRQPLKIGPFGTALVGILEKERSHLNGLRTYTAVGHHLGISRSRVREILEGERPMTFDEFMGLCEYCVIDPRGVVRQVMEAVFLSDPDTTGPDGVPAWVEFFRMERDAQLADLFVYPNEQDVPCEEDTDRGDG